MFDLDRAKSKFLNALGMDTNRQNEIEQLRTLAVDKLKTRYCMDRGSAEQLIQVVLLGKNNSEEIAQEIKNCVEQEFPGNTAEVRFDEVRYKVTVRVTNATPFDDVIIAASDPAVGVFNIKFHDQKYRDCGGVLSPKEFLDGIEKEIANFRVANNMSSAAELFASNSTVTVDIQGKIWHEYRQAVTEFFPTDGKDGLEVIVSFLENQDETITRIELMFRYSQRNG